MEAYLQISNTYQSYNIKLNQLTQDYIENKITKENYLTNYCNISSERDNLTLALKRFYNI